MADGVIEWLSVDSTFYTLQEPDASASGFCAHKTSFYIYNDSVVLGNCGSQSVWEKADHVTLGESYFVLSTLRHVVNHSE